MGNVTLPTPVFLAGGGLCLVAGYLVGAMGPDTTARTTGQVVSFDATTSRLCLRGGGTQDQPGVDSHGVLCGTWDHSDTSAAPRKGRDFRFVSIADAGKKVVIYGDVTG